MKHNQDGCTVCWNATMHMAGMDWLKWRAEMGWEQVSWSDETETRDEYFERITAWWKGVSGE